MHGSPDFPGTPRWVKVSAVVAGILLLAAIAVAVLGGSEHGPWRHLSANAGAGGALAATIAEFGPAGRSGCQQPGPNGWIRA